MNSNVPQTTPDLSLVSINELTAEIERRCETFICAMRFAEPDEKNQEIKTKVGHGKWSDAVGLATILQDDCLHAWPDGEVEE